MQMNVDELLRRAMLCHQSGALGDAEMLYRQILKRQPNHPDALHLLGVLAAQCGHVDQGVALVGQAVAIRPDFHQAWANLGRLLADKGKLGESVAAYDRATKLAPHDAMSWYAMALVRRRSADDQGAKAALLTCLEVDPRLAEAHNELAKIYRADGRVEEAIASAKRAIELNRRFADAHHSLANALLDNNQTEQAITEYGLAVELDSGVSQFHISLGEALCSKERFVDAVSAFNRGLMLRPASGSGRSGMAVALCGLNRFEEALAFHQTALELEPGNLKFHRDLADTLTANNDIQGARRCLERALEIGPGDLPTLIAAGNLFSRGGDFVKASACFRKALEIDPSEPSAYRALAGITAESASPEIAKLLALLGRPDLSENERIMAGFGLGKLLDAADQFDDAFKWYQDANSRFRAQCAADNARFDQDETNRKVDQAISHFSAAFFESRRSWGEASDAPVFIVGMPRSGTTLTEQIIASHPLAFGAGELTQMSTFSASLNAAGAPADWRAEKIAELAKSHLAYLQSLGGTALRIVDKMPGNVMSLGLVATLFPNARIIFCQRDSRDTCLSCYFQFFGKRNLLFSYDLIDCATQYLEQQRLTAHWLKVLPLRMMTMQYEELVADLEGQSRRLIDFLGLEWDPACLDFHKTERPIATASVWQVRQPIYNSSVGRWRHYEKHLGPLLEALKGAV